MALGGVGITFMLHYFMRMDDTRGCWGDMNVTLVYGKGRWGCWGDMNVTLVYGKGRWGCWGDMNVTLVNENEWH